MTQLMISSVFKDVGKTLIHSRQPDSKVPSLSNRKRLWRCHAVFKLENYIYTAFSVLTDTLVQCSAVDLNANFADTDDLYALFWATFGL